MSQPPLVGKVIDDYRVLKEIGRGGMGVVYEAENVHLERRVALKFISPALAKDRSFIRRFRQEARALAKIAHPGIVTVHGFRPTNDGAYIAMEFIEGETLGERLEREGPFSWQAALPLIKQLLRAFSYAHQRGIIHRDIKPSNIMLTPDGDIKVMDFGLAKSIAERTGTTTATNGQIGTLWYMSPEQARSDPDIDHRSDLFSLGLTFYEMLSGRLPFDKSSGQFVVMKSIIEEQFPEPQRFNPDIPRPLASVLMKVLEKEPDRRYQDADAMLEALEAFEQKMTTALRSRPASRQRGQRLSLTVLVLLIVLGGGYGIWKYITASQETRTLLMAEAETAATRAEEQQTEGFSSASDDDEVDVASGAGMLRITSSPPGATIFIDGVAQGRTPHTLNGLEAGQHQIRLEHAGHESYTGTATVEAGQTRLVDVTLTVLPGTLRILAQPWGDLYVNNRLIRRDAETRQTVGLPAGQQRVRVENPNFGTWERTVTLSPGRPLDVVVDFTERVNLTITSKTGDGQFVTAEIYVDGTSANAWTPREIAVPLGRRRIEARTTGYQNAEVVLMVDAQTPRRLEIELQRITQGP